MKPFYPISNFLSIVYTLTKMRSKILMWVIIIGSALFFINQGIFNRWIGYETKPAVMLDEFDYVWQGLSLRTTGLPIAWSTYPDLYKQLPGGFNKQIDNGLDADKFRNHPQPIVTIKELDFGEGTKQLTFVAPFFDRPPLGGLIYSLNFNDSQTILDIKPPEFRKVSLILGIIVSVLIFFFGFLLTNNPWVGVLSTAIYNTVPTYVFASRFTLGETVVSPLVLLELIFIALANKFKNSLKIFLITLFGAGLFGGAAFLAKESAVGFTIGCFALLIYWKVNLKALASFLAGFLLPILIYISWGFWLQGALFWQVFLSNLGRPFFGALKFVTIFQGLRFQDFPIDGWWIWGFVAMFLTCIYLGKDYLLLILPTIFHLSVVIFLGGSNYPWYYLSLIPFFSIYSAVLLSYSFQFPKASILVPFFFFGVSSSFYWGYSTLHSLSDGVGYKLLFLVFFLILFLRIRYSQRRIFRLIWCGFFVLFLYEVFKWNNYSVMFLTQNWGNLPIPSLPKM